ncbi:MAG: patched family protein, partial [Bacteroidia bacterium]|nr:patched family protein [Bacteroidia bacterium]
MAYETSKIELSYDFAKILPDDDSSYVEYVRFKKQFGEDGNVMVIGFEDKDLFRLNKINDWYRLTDSIKGIQGIKGVMSLTSLYKIVKNDSLEKFEFTPLITKPFSNQQEVDSFKKEVFALPFYK